MTKHYSRQATASLESLHRVFTTPEDDHSTLTEIEKAISQDLNGFLNKHVVAKEKRLSAIEQDFLNTQMPECPTYVSDHVDAMMDKLIAHSVNTASPSFIGHMTSALPYFTLPLGKLMMGMNQNLVKIETSKAFTPLERQLLGVLHRLVYEQSSSFYDKWLHHADAALGALCSGGTVANMTALWVARNQAFPISKDFPGVQTVGYARALAHFGYKDCVILISERCHYSFRKTADLLGLGRDAVIAIPTTADNKIDLNALSQRCVELTAQRKKVLAIIGIAGTTETGSVDPLTEMAVIAKHHQTYFHVDAAWGGATLLSKEYKSLLKGIEEADSVTIDAHKQLYAPMGAGFVIFKSPNSLNVIKSHANYIVRAGSKDLGRYSMEGSRPGMAFLVHACLTIIGRQGYEILINESITKAKFFAQLIEQHADFEVMSKPELCIFTYRYCPDFVQNALNYCNEEQRYNINQVLNQLTTFIQKKQRESGLSFVSRTTLNPHHHGRQPITVFRVVLANPLTKQDILREVLTEQYAISQQARKLHYKLRQLVNYALSQKVS